MHYLGAFVSTFSVLMINILNIAGGNGKVHIWFNEMGDKLQISPQFLSGMGHNLILKKKYESLNLTCSVAHKQNDKNNMVDHTLDWTAPLHVIGNGGILKGQAQNVAWLWFDKLTENHTGNYTCSDMSDIKLGQTLFPITIYLSVKKTEMTYCGSQWFKCRSKRCIMKRYVCDGKNDCAYGEDESIEAGCGPDPCYGKVVCKDRCIPPDWCCDHRNCSPSFESQPWQPETHELSCVQTALYHTVIGWAMAFMFIITLLLIAICRVYIKKAMAMRWWQQNEHISRQVEQNLSEDVNIIDNFNSRLQFISQTHDPPSYLEVISTPPQERPPPSYESCQNLIDQSSNVRIASEIVTYNLSEIPLTTSRSYNSSSDDTTDISNIFQDISASQPSSAAITTRSITNIHNNLDVINLTSPNTSES